MKRLFLFVWALTLSISLVAREEGKLDLNVGFASYFDNKEYKDGNDKTVFGSRITPRLSTSLKSGKYSHTINAAVGFLRDFGNKTTTYEPSAWYTLDTRLGEDTRFSFTCGIFPCALLGMAFPTSILDGEIKWYKPNIQGMLMKISNTNLNALLGINWTGQFGANPDTHEQFSIFSIARYELSDVLKFGYYLNAVHRANSLTVKGVVDNILAEPWVSMTISDVLGSKSQFVLTGACLLGYQRDRIRDHENKALEQYYIEHPALKPQGFDPKSAIKYPVCADLQLTLKKYSFAIDNHTYFGDNVMPFYYDQDKAGNMYGSKLYSGDPFFAFNKDKGFYDRLELSWNPQIGKAVSLKLASVFHFTQQRCVSQQTMTLYVNL